MKFAFVVATKVGREASNLLPINKTLGMMNHIKQGVSVDVCPIYNNKRGLATVYNEFLENPHAADYDYIVFIHDDVWLNDVLLFQKLMDSEFDVIGLCGGKQWVVNPDTEVRNIWTKACKGEASGFVVHSPKPDTFFASGFGVAPQRTVTLDGQFICFTRKAVEAGLKFDERFQWHYYDMDVCVQANKLGLKVGTAPILATHQSLGQSVMSPEFMTSQKQFIDKWFVR